MLDLCWWRCGNATRTAWLSDPPMDRDRQFTSDKYQRFLGRHNLVCSLRTEGRCAYSAAAQSFFGVPKRERANRRCSQNRCRRGRLFLITLSDSRTRASTGYWKHSSRMNYS